MSSYLYGLDPWKAEQDDQEDARGGEMDSG